MDLHPKQFVRVDVRTLEDEVGRVRPVDRHLSVDPRTVTLDRLKQLVAKAMDIRGEFCVSLLKGDDDERVQLGCDWDLEGVMTQETRHLQLALTLQPQESGLEEWDIICPIDVPAVEATHSTRNKGSSFLEQVFHLSPSRPPLSLSEFVSLRDHPGPLRHALYRAGGAEHRLRPRLWLHLLDVYPEGSTEEERKEFVERKAEEYRELRDAWQKGMERSKGAVPPLLHEITCLVRKDVSRTDPSLDLDEGALYNVLTTYALHHPSVRYRQGMSDLLSPLLRIMVTESLAYLAFCGLMRRTRRNFRRDSRSMRLKFRHLRRLLRLHDPALHRHLARVGALELPFCYRWLLLDLKREFPYRDVPTLNEVLWSTLPPLGPAHEGVALYEKRRSDCRATRGRNVSAERGEVEESSSEEEEFSLPRRKDMYRTEADVDPPSSDESLSEGRRWQGSCDSNYESDEDPIGGESCTSSGQASAHTPTLTDDSGAEEEAEPEDSLLPPPHRLGDGKPFLLFLCLALLTEHRDAILSRGMDAGEIGIHFDAWLRRQRLDRVLPRARERFDEYLRTGWTDE